MSVALQVVSTRISYDFLMLLAEVGGYVGLFLGVSILQLIDTIKYAVVVKKRIKRAGAELFLKFRAKTKS